MLKSSAANNLDAAANITKDTNWVVNKNAISANCAILNLDI